MKKNVIIIANDEKTNTEVSTNNNKASKLSKIFSNLGAKIISWLFS